MHLIADETWIWENYPTNYWFLLKTKLGHGLNSDVLRVSKVIVIRPIRKDTEKIICSMQSVRTSVADMMMLQWLSV
jgi:hypothetical protein